MIAPSAASPPGSATPVDGGYRVQGRWKWGTGVMHADWIMVNALEPVSYTHLDVYKRQVPNRVPMSAR